MSRIAIIDTMINREYLHGKTFEHINLCGENKKDINQKINHGTLCAMVLDSCASDYELVNIQILRDSKVKAYGEITLLAKALEVCRDLKIDVVSLSAVSSILSDSKYLFDSTCDLARNTVIVSALDNKRYVTVPTSFPHVLGVRSDFACILSPGEIAYQANDPFGVNLYVNCDFAFLRENHYGPSNSLAVPVVAAYVNNLLNQGQSVSEIESLLRQLKSYPIRREYEEIYFPLWPKVNEIPVVFLADVAIGTCCAFMDNLYEKYEVQSTALSLVEGPYDIRIKTVKDIGTIQEDLYFMEQHYKTDIIFIVGGERLLEEVQKIINIDVKLIYRDNWTSIVYENSHEIESNSRVLGRLYEILTS